MPVQFDSFDQGKVDRLKNHLVTMAAKNQPKPYEIFVDGMKAVPKTDEPNEFDGYENYLAHDSEQVKICIYNSPNAQRNDQYVFMLKARNRQEAMEAAMNGVGQGFTLEAVNDLRTNQSQHQRTLWDMELLKKENDALKKQLAEAEEYGNTLTTTLEAAKSNGNKIGGIHWGEVFSVALEGIARRNTHLIAQIPGAAGLAGVIEKDNLRSAETFSPENEATFKKKSEEPISEQEQALRDLVRQMQHSFNGQELDQVMLILDSLCRDKSQLQTVVELLEEEPEQPTQENNH